MDNPYLAEAAKRYKTEIDKNFYINPISEADASIIELIQNFISAYELDDFHHLLTQYKQISDTEFYDLLKDHKIEKILSKNFDDAEIKENSRFIKMNDFTQTRLQKRYIIDYSLDIVIESETEKEIPVIILNMTDPHNNKAVAYGNRHLFYNSYKDRNEDVLKLDKYL